MNVWINKQNERRTQSAVEVKVKGQKGRACKREPDSGQLFCTTCVQVALVLCEPLRIMAHHCQRKNCPGSRPLLLFVQRFLLLCCKIWILRFTAFLPQPWAFQNILPDVVRGQHNSQVWFNSVTVALVLTTPN